MAAWFCCRKSQCGPYGVWSGPASAAGNHRSNDQRGRGRGVRRFSACKAPMIGLDTNILIRYLTQDDPVQSPKATEVIERRLNLANPGFISVVTMAEIVWVLDRAYGLTPSEIAAAIERILQVEVLTVENEQEVFGAMVAL